MKLLQKTIRQYFLYSFIVLVITIPVFYYFLLNIVREDIDEDLFASRQQIIPKLKSAVANNALYQFNFLDHDLAITKSSNTRVFDTLYTINVFDEGAKESVPHRVLATNIDIGNNFYLIHIRTSLLDYDNLIEAILGIQVFLLLLLFAGLQIINRNLTRNIWRPFYLTLDSIKGYNVEEHKKLRLASSPISEFNDLNTTLEHLAQRNYNAFINQKEFAENASHEMQTPLAILQGKLELLMQTFPLKRDQAILIEEMSDAIQRMIRLNKSLILLTKIDNDQFTEKEKISLKETFENLIQQFKPQIHQKRITIEARMPVGISLIANKALIEILCSNLLSNAIRHNHEGGCIKIELQSDRITIENTGKGIALEEQKILQRFQKDSSDSNSIGLGLEIVKKICNLYSYSLTYEYFNHLHRFSVQFAEH